jgi:RecA-family ATPase
MTAPFNPADLDYFPPGEPIDMAAWRNEHDAKAPAFRRIINPADWEGLPIPPREWIVPDYIPDRTVSLLGGDGATGKSLLALQLAAARALGREWIGLLPEPGRTLVLSAEDDADEMQRRFDDIRKFYGAQMAALSDIRLVDLVGEYSILGALMKGQIEPTAIYHALDAYMTEFKPGLTVLDVLADMFSGDENSRPQSRQFIGLLKKLARNHDCAFLLLAHPSLTGMSTGSGMSGSTGWNNAVRSRMYFQTAKASDGTEPNKNLRTLEGMKSNYGVRGGKIDLKWENGLFVPVQGATGLDKLAAEAKTNDLFMEIVKLRNTQERAVSDKHGANYAPIVFAKDQLAIAAGISAKQFENAMERLFKAGKIKVEPLGPPSRQTRKIVEIED